MKAFEIKDMTGGFIRVVERSRNGEAVGVETITQFFMFNKPKDLELLARRLMRDAAWLRRKGKR